MLRDSARDAPFDEPVIVVGDGFNGRTNRIESVYEALIRETKMEGVAQDSASSPYG